MLHQPPRATPFPYTTLFRSPEVAAMRRTASSARSVTRLCRDSPLPSYTFTCCHGTPSPVRTERSEEHTSELQSRGHLVCRLLLEKKNRQTETTRQTRTTQAA